LTKNQIERMNKINELIKLISNTDRRFFYSKTKDKIGKFIEGKTVVYYIDSYSQEKVHLNNICKDSGFSHGGTLWGLIHDFKHWILTGKYSNGKNGYGGLYSPNWGYTKEGMELVRNKGEEIGFLKTENK
jgi:elongation factor P hydroxylase